MKMRNRTVRVVGLLLAIGLMAPAAWSQAAAPDAGPRGEALRNFNDAAEKLMRLADKIPADKYTWKPVEGVRTFSEVFLHVAAGNFNITRRLGPAIPEGIQINAQFEKSTTEKEKVMELLKRSIEHVRAAYTNLPDADVEKTTAWFGGRQASLREIMFFIASHNHEHLGQAIAYTRMAGMVPPWTEERMQQAPPKKAN